MSMLNLQEIFVNNLKYKLTFYFHMSYNKNNNNNVIAERLKGDRAMADIIATGEAPGAIGPYSQGYVIPAGAKIVYTSGQIPIDPANGGLVAGSIREQAEQSCKNVIAILEAAGCSAESVVKTTCFLADMNDFTEFNEVYAKYFTSKPARSCVAVKTLPKNVLCEIEAIAAF